MQRTGSCTTASAANLIQCRDEQHVQQALRMLSKWVEQAGFELQPTRSRIVRVAERQSLDFLGYHFELSRRPPTRVVRSPRDRSLQRFKDSDRDLTHRLQWPKSGAGVARPNRTLSGFFENFKHGAKAPFVRLDGWARGRVRAILCGRRTPGPMLAQSVRRRIAIRNNGSNR